jgi:DNA-directed RNA polymerase subunit RPC12/RpoP
MKVSWRQVTKNQLIISLDFNQQQKDFLLDDSVVNFLAETKHVHLHIQAEVLAEENVLVNFTGIKPLVAGQSAMGPGKTITGHKEKSQADRLAIARGETFASKWLTPKGWDREKHYFPLKPFTNGQNSTQVTCPACGKNIRESVVFCGYCGHKVGVAPEIKNCINKDCEKIIKASAAYCPYCGIKQ